MGIAEMVDNYELRACLSCGDFFPVRRGEERVGRCSVCLLDRRFVGRFGSLIVQGADDPPKLPQTQREWAKTKREFYQVITTLQTIEEKKAQFIQDAMRAADEMVAQIEQELGTGVNELRSREQQLRGLIQQYMSASGRTEQVIKDLLVEVREEVVNAGNRPLWKEITRQMGDLLGWTKEQLKEFVRANHSMPQYGERMHVTKLPPGRRQLKKTQLADHSLVKVAEAEKELMDKSGLGIISLVSPEGHFFLTRRLVEANGLKVMLERQNKLKQGLKVTDVEQEGTVTRICVEGPCAFDPNTVRAFVSDRFPSLDGPLADVFVVNRTKIALEVGPPQPVGNSASVAMEFFDFMIDVFGNLLEAETSRGEVATGLMGEVQGRNQAALPSDVGDLSLQRERSRPSSGAPGAFGDGTRSEGGIMSPAGGAPVIST
jgi:hypothetical protein